MAAIKPNYPPGSPEEHIELCDHHNLPVDVICEDCDEFIYGNCAKRYHRDHEWSTIPTAVSKMRRDLLNCLRKFKEEEIRGIDEKIETISKQITENKKLFDYEIKKLQEHYDEITSRLSDVRKFYERILRDHLDEKHKKLNGVKSELNKKKKEIAETVKFMEARKIEISDNHYIDNLREMTQLLSALGVDINNFKYSVRYYKGEISNEVLKHITGKSLDLNSISLTETSSFKYGDRRMVLLRAVCEDQCYIQQFESPYTKLVNKEGDIKHKYNIKPNDMCVTDTGDVYFTDFTNYFISCLSQSGSVSTVVSTDPLVPGGICQSIDGGILVTLTDYVTNTYILESHSRRLVRHITVTGDVMHEYSYQEDGQTRLFTYPVRVTQNSNRDICVVNKTSDTTGDLVIISLSGHMKSVYYGQNLTEDFGPTDVVCDSFCNILVTDLDNNQIHM
ncbi:uncharacterized protein LOC133187014 [Saccostrea echinata]|uniref:uncharacterized protein LOC133187014 n=1 Tax=Saccostrea echinata TaxID=191078 RepID=UPI002A7F5AC8|nr:uncharacterized protein LOC133187014 [Saccostrea echinata]